MTAIQTEQFTQRTAQIVGRSDELVFLNECLNDSKCSHFVYYYGQGGIGKTRMLEEVLQMIDASKKQCRTSRILDLYHTETHDPNDIEHTIVTRLDPEERYFGDYLRTWDQYQKLTQRGGSPDQIKQERGKLTDCFIEGANRLAKEVDKIVLLFDTMEQIQLDSSIVEEKIGMPNIDPRIRGWMLKTLPKISNVVVVFAGRPKERQAGETRDPQKRLLDDMSEAFSGRFHAKELEPLKLKEAEALIERISEGRKIFTDEDLPVIYAITGGRPILLHLIFDLFNGLSEQPAREKELLKSYASIVGEMDKSILLKAQQEFEQKITSCIYENTGIMGEYLSRMALMPKGVDHDIMVNILGLPEAESREFLDKARKLSFVKTYATPNGPAVERIFLHDEMYRLINSTLKPHYLRSNERAIARNLIDRYYKPQIDELKQKLLAVNETLKALNDQALQAEAAQDVDEESPEETGGVPRMIEPGNTQETTSEELEAEIKRYAAKAYYLNNQIHKLQIDTFYYQLAQDPAEGYRLYKQLGYQSAMDRVYGYDIPLLDEFLRFYNSQDHRDWFKKVGILPEQVVRESALLWIERFHWCADYVIETEFAKSILAKPEELNIDPEQHISLLANICALADRAQVMMHGYNLDQVKEEEELLKRFQATQPDSEEELIALVRLCTTIGYAYRSGGQFDKAIPINQTGLRAMRRLKELYHQRETHETQSKADLNPYLGEEIILKNNMAFVLAKQGRFTEANITIRAAHRLSQGKPHLRYSTGLTLTIMASIERLQGKHYEALMHGHEAKKIFQEMGDHHGVVRSLHNIGSAYRQLAEQELARGNMERAMRNQRIARKNLEHALQVAEDGKLNDQAVGMKAELGKIHRGIGKILVAQGHPKEEYIPILQTGEGYLRQTLESKRWIQAERADIREDLAELLYVMGNREAALLEAQNVEKDVEHKAQVAPGSPEIPERVTGWIALPLGKAEGLRFKISMDKKNYEEAIEHFIFSYVYYYRYSARAHQIQHLIETLFDRYLSHMAYKERSDWLKDMKYVIKAYEEKIGGVDLSVLSDLMQLVDV